MENGMKTGNGDMEEGHGIETWNGDMKWRME